MALVISNQIAVSVTNASGLYVVRLDHGFTDIKVGTRFVFLHSRVAIDEPTSHLVNSKGTITLVRLLRSSTVSTIENERDLISFQRLQNQFCYKGLREYVRDVKWREQRSNTFVAFIYGISHH